MSNGAIVVTNSLLKEKRWPTLLAAWLTFEQVSCKFENIGGVTPPRPHRHISAPWSLHAVCRFREQFNMCLNVASNSKSSA